MAGKKSEISSFVMQDLIQQFQYVLDTGLAGYDGSVTFYGFITIEN